MLIDSERDLKLALSMRILDVATSLWEAFFGLRYCMPFVSSILLQLEQQFIDLELAGFPGGTPLKSVGRGLTKDFKKLIS